jgi:exonuclease SbcC
VSPYRGLKKVYEKEDSKTSKGRNEFYRIKRCVVMFKKLEIINFQSHKHSILEFHPGVNIIKGNTDTGKTAVVRGIKLLNFNRPTGDAFKSHWGGQMSISLETDDHKIERIKGTKNMYKLDKVEMTAFGTDVPQEIVHALNMTETNYKFQHDGFFLLSDTAGEVAQFFNKISHLDKIDKGVRFLKSQIRSQNNTVKANKAFIKDKKTKYKQYKRLLKNETDLEVVESSMSNLRRSQNAIKNLSKLLVHLQQTKKQLNKLRKQQEIAPAVNKNINRLSAIKQTNDKKKTLLNLITKIKTIQSDLEKLQILLKLKPAVIKCKKQVDKQKELGFSKIKLVSLLKKTQSIQTKLKNHQTLLVQEQSVVSLLKKINTFKKDNQQLKDLTTKIEIAQQTAVTNKKLKRKLETLETEFHNNFPEICPLCGK